MKKSEQKNSGATLLLVLGLFVLLTVVAANMLMLVNAGNTSTAQEYEAEQTNLALESIFDVLNTQVQTDLGTNHWYEAFASGGGTISFPNGFEAPDGSIYGVEMRVEMSGNGLAKVTYEITLPSSEAYQIVAQYTCNGSGSTMTATLKECQKVAKMMP